MSRVDAGYVAYLVRENAWLRARCTDLTDRLAELQERFDELDLAYTVLRARLDPGEDPDGSERRLASDPPEARRRGLGVETTPGDPFADATDVVRLPPSPRPPPPLDGSP